MYIKVENENIVGIYAENIKEGLIEIDSMPKAEERIGYNPVPYYRDGKIVYEYEPIPKMPEEEEMPIPEIPYEQQVVNKIRERYSIDDELAILRQRDTKPDEFEAYNAYAESCKKEARLLIEKQNE